MHVEEPADPRRLLFVTRRDAPTRHLSNYDVVVAMLARFGFEHVSSGEMSFDEQVRTFSEARMVVGVCGAALANLAFMPRGGRVVMLTPATMPGCFFWEVAHHRELAFNVMWGPNDDPAAHHTHGDFSVDTDALERVVDAELAQLHH
jgi:capsular polysaccharide biosynthesis protein